MPERRFNSRFSLRSCLMSRICTGHGLTHDTLEYLYSGQTRLRRACSKSVIRRLGDGGDSALVLFRARPLCAQRFKIPRLKLRLIFLNTKRRFFLPLEKRERGYANGSKSRYLGAISSNPSNDATTVEMRSLRADPLSQATNFAAKIAPSVIVRGYRERINFHTTADSSPDRPLVKGLIGYWAKV